MTLAGNYTWRVLPINDDEFLAWSRLQVGLAVATGVLVIVITTAAVILIGRAPGGVPSGLPEYSGPPVASVSDRPSPAPSATASEPPASQPTASVHPTATKKPTSGSTTPPATTPAPSPPSLVAVGCDSNSVQASAQIRCTVSISVAQQSDVVIGLSCDLCGAPLSATVRANVTTGEFDVTGSTPGEATLTASFIGVQKTFKLTITP